MSWQLCVTETFKGLLEHAFGVWSEVRSKASVINTVILPWQQTFVNWLGSTVNAINLLSHFLRLRFIIECLTTTSCTPRFTASGLCGPISEVQIGLHHQRENVTLRRVKLIIMTILLLPGKHLLSWQRSPEIDDEVWFKFIDNIGTTGLEDCYESRTRT